MNVGKNISLVVIAILVIFFISIIPKVKNHASLLLLVNNNTNVKRVKEINSLKHFPSLNEEQQEKSLSYLSISVQDSNNSITLEQEPNNKKDIDITVVTEYETKIIKGELNLLAKLIESEAGDEPYLGKVAVGNVVLNRCKMNNQSINDVIFAKSQFDGVQTGAFNKEPSQESIKAANEVLSGKTILPDAYFFCNLKLCEIPDWAKIDTFVVRIGDHWFFRR